MGPREVPHKIWAQSVQPLIDVYWTQTDGQTPWQAYLHNIDFIILDLLSYYYPRSPIDIIIQFLRRSRIKYHGSPQILYYHGSYKILLSWISLDIVILDLIRYYYHGSYKILLSWISLDFLLTFQLSTKIKMHLI